MRLVEQYRPITLDDLVGQDDVVARLTRAVKRGIGGRVFLFQGPSGCGKTSGAMALARHIGIITDDETLRDVTSGSVLCDLNFYRAKDVDQRSIGDMHGWMWLSCLRGEFKMVVIDEAQTMTQGARDAFLSILETLPDHVVVVLTTTEEALGDDLFGFQSPFGSRCKQIRFATPEQNDIVDRLAQIAYLETGDGVAIPYAAIVKEGRSNLRACVELLEDHL